MLFSLETGFAHASDRLPLSRVGLNPNGNFFTLQSRIAFELRDCIAEIDINPMIVNPEQAVAVDALVLPRKPD